MKLYLAGPMSGLPDHNRPAFHDAAQALRLRGHEVLNPAEWDEDMPIHVDEELTWEWYLRRDLARFLDPLAGVEAVAVLPGWEESRGANLEVAVAHRLGIEVYEYRGGFLGAQVLGPLAEPDPAPPEYEWSAPIVTRYRWAPDEAVVGDDPRERSLGAQDDEVIVTDPATGGQKGQKLAQIGALDPLALLEVGRVAGFGARKYDRFNYLRGYAWSLSFDAGERHRMAHWAGEERDPESGLYHLAHAAWHDLAQLSFLLRGIGTDDRPPPLDRGE